MNLRKMIKASAFAALICIATIIFVFPLAGAGYANLGDCLVLLAGFTLGPVYGACAAGIGSMLADLFTGYVIYMPASLLIKAAMAVIVSAVAGRARRTGFGRTLLAVTAAECAMVAGYFAYECLILGAKVAAVDVVGNAVQGGASVLVAAALWTVACRTPAADFLRS